MTLKFSIEIQAATAAFNQAMKQAASNYSETTANIRRDSNALNASAAAAGDSLYKSLNIKPNSALTQEVVKIGTELQKLKQDAAIPAGELNRVTQAAVARINELKRELTGVQPAAAQAATGVKVIGDNAANVGNQLIGLRNQVAAFVGVNLGANVFKDAIATADAFNNLQARVKLATGAGEGFKAAFTEVAAIALRTGSNLEQTGILFTRVTESGKSAGLSTQAAIAQSLKLTETINQAVQLSGGSAQSSNAAITQLIQGLQSGVVRGEEFNSIMEQSPRLAKALSDGLGVTSGELRKMAEAGALSADVVIGAIKSQSDALKNEFGTLPATVGRAIENLQTKWSLYIGELDKSKGVTSRLAEAINVLASNLNTVISVLTTGAAIYVANAALQRLSGDSAQTAAIKVAAQGAASAEAAIATRAHGVAATTAATQVGAYGAAAGNAGSAAASGALGRFAGLTGAVTGFVSKLGLIGVAAVAGFEILKTVQESVLNPFLKKISGLTEIEKQQENQRKSSEQQILRNKEALEALALAETKASNEAFNLSKQATNLIAGFDKARTSGDSAAESIAKIGKDFDLSKIQGIRDAGGVLDKLLADGKITASEFEKAWGDALKGTDLLQFETLAKTAFDKVGRSGTQLAQAIDAGLSEAVKRTGLDFEVISGGMGKASRSAINDTDTIIAGLDKLKAKGIDIAQALTASIGNGIEAVKANEALDSVKRQIEAVRGKLGETVANGLLDEAAAKSIELKKKLEDVTPGINSVGEAFRKMGLVTREESTVTAKTFGEAFEAIQLSGQATAGQLQTAFKKYAEAAIAANGGVATSMIVGKAEALGLKVTIDEAGNSIVSAMSKSANSTDNLSGKLSNATTEAERLTTAIEGRVAAEEKSLELARRQKAVNDAKRGVDAEGFSLDATGKRAVSASTNKSEFIKEAIAKGLTPAEALALADESSTRVNKGGNGFSGNGLGGNGGGTVEVFNTNKFYEALEKAVLENIRKQAKPIGNGFELGLQNFRLNPPVSSRPISPPIGGNSSGRTVNVNFVLGNKTARGELAAEDEGDFLDMLARAKGVS